VEFISTHPQGTAEHFLIEARDPAEDVEELEDALLLGAVGDVAELLRYRLAQVPCLRRVHHGLGEELAQADVTSANQRTQSFCQTPVYVTVSAREKGGELCIFKSFARVKMRDCFLSARTASEYDHRRISSEAFRFCQRLSNCGATKTFESLRRTPSGEHRKPIAHCPNQTQSKSIRYFTSGKGEHAVHWTRSLQNFLPEGHMS